MMLVKIAADVPSKAWALSVIQTEERLEELIAWTDSSTADFFVSNGQIILSPDWTDTLPPILIADVISAEAPLLLALIFMRLGNWEKTYAYMDASDAAFAAAVDLLNRLQNNVLLRLPAAPPKVSRTFSAYQLLHNRAVAMHYGTVDTYLIADDIRAAYLMAIDAAPDADYRAYTLKHYATFLIDQQLLAEAKHLLTQALSTTTKQHIRAELLFLQYNIGLQQLVVPYDALLLAQIKDAIWEVLQYFEDSGQSVRAALVLTDAAQIANFSNSFSEALGYLNRAIQIFRDEQLAELEAHANYRKGILLFTWAQSGNPQFYRGAMLAYQEALKVFTREATPEVFAEIQHHLGVIYSQIPDEAKKKSIWAAVSNSSFRQALEIFTIDLYPYEYASVCNHYANALTKYPAAKLTDNYRKALELYREALIVRTPHDYPYERALTILNYLEACWLVNEEDTEAQKRLYMDMQHKAAEISRLVQDDALIAEATRHQEKLAELGRLLTYSSSSSG
jgi:tetratricopeptide (TPR) repeat protein